MKIALITDTHWGVRNDNQALIDNNKKFLDNTLFPYLKEHNIKTVVHLGDLVDRRKYINYFTAQKLREDFIEPMLNMGIHFYWILGNHDIYYRQSLEVNAAQELYKEYTCGLDFYMNPTEVSFDGVPILFVPWICDENRERTLEAINNTQARYLFGHLEMTGFEMFRGVVSHHGENPDLFKKFDTVCSGHYHHKSSHGNIHYLGSHGEFTWADYADRRGFHTFDTSSGSLDFVYNPYTMFEKVRYDDASGTIADIDFSKLSGKFVKVVVSNRNMPLQYDRFMSQIEAAGPLDLQVVQDHLNMDLTDDDTIVNESKDTLSIILDYAKTTNNAVNSVKLTSLLSDLYQSAQSAE